MAPGPLADELPREANLRDVIQRCVEQDEWVLLPVLKCCFCNRMILNVRQERGSPF